ncbi:MAG TPA: PAS domain-containing protein, partial [Candidatus Limnocylindrales bacterium]|nr:PAS domain-containing protein [Candidatus Limnocylindrales bacterium]
MSVLPSVDYQALFNSLPGSYIAFLPDDPNFTIVAESNAHASITMVKPGEVIGKPLFEVFPDTSSKYQETGISDLVESLRMVTKTGLPDTMPALRYDITSADGELTTKYWQITHYPLFDDNNELALIYQATEDITDRVATRDKLERTQQQLREALSAGIIGTWLWDIQKNIVIGDQYMAAMFGVSEKAAAAGLPLKTFVQAIHPDDRRRVQDQIAEALKSQDLYESEYRTVGKDGTVRWLIARGRTEADEQGNPVRFPGAIINITERKLIENNQKFLAKASITLASTL